VRLREREANDAVGAEGPQHHCQPSLDASLASTLEGLTIAGQDAGEIVGGAPAGLLVLAIEIALTQGPNIVCGCGNGSMRAQRSRAFGCRTSSRARAATGLACSRSTTNVRRTPSWCAATRTLLTDDDGRSGTRSTFSPTRRGSKRHTYGRANCLMARLLNPVGPCVGIARGELLRVFSKALRVFRCDCLHADNAESGGQRSQRGLPTMVRHVCPGRPG
jgi:hypothetical protein